MRMLTDMLRLLLLFTLLTAISAGMVQAADRPASGFGEIAIPTPDKPSTAELCVEPTDVMRRDHMKFLDHQRDLTVIDGDRGSKYSLAGCMDCHNPAGQSGKIIRYEDPEHFCAECHAYASVKIDCFECHADRGLGKLQQGRLETRISPWGNDALYAVPFTAEHGVEHAD
jgi:predicted CXXCH cytochrome family protein